MNDLRRNVINSQNLNNVKNLRATWVNENAEKIDISKNKEKKWEKKEKKRKKRKKKNESTKMKLKIAMTM